MVDKGDYDVGHGKPPRHTRWAKGQSGNPRGRGKGSRGLKTDLAAALDQVQTIENKLTGRKVKATNQSHALQRLAERAALGDIKAAQALLPLIVQVLGIEDRGGAKEQLSAADRALLEELLGGDGDDDSSGDADGKSEGQGDGKRGGDSDDDDAGRKGQGDGEAVS